MGIKGTFVSTVLVIDTFFISFAVGFNQRHVLVVDPKLPRYQEKAKPVLPDKSKTGSESGTAKPEPAGKQGAKTTDAAGGKGAKPAGKEQSGKSQQAAGSKGGQSASKAKTTQAEHKSHTTKSAAGKSHASHTAAGKAKSPSEGGH